VVEGLKGQAHCVTLGGLPCAGRQVWRVLPVTTCYCALERLSKLDVLLAAAPSVRVLVATGHTGATF
jgi:hypothetical protein